MQRNDRSMEVLSALSPVARAIAEVLLVLHEVGDGVAGIWDDAQTEITKTIKEVG